jgi:NAD(P)-dependent dehydrogenase (short-subunit alcohol dehydrogenase family)
MVTVDSAKTRFQLGLRIRMSAKEAGNRAALVTGGAKRIGAAIVADLAAHGFKLAIHYHGSDAEALALAHSIREEGGTAEILCCDLSRPQECSGLIERAAAKLGPVDLLVNNASTFLPDRADQPDLALMDLHFAVHVKAPTILAAAFSAQKNLHEGLIVNVIDQRVLAPTPKFYSYMLSKAALWMATQTMAQTFAPRIRVNAIGPGPTLPSERQSAQDFARQTMALPLGHGPTLDEFGATVRYFYENRSITGQMIALDGGQHLAWRTPDIADIIE